VSYVSVGALYLAGLARDEERWRHAALTGVESLAVVPPLVRLTKLTFGRQRPDANQGPTAWFEDGTSFVSDAASPPFAAAEVVSEALDYKWWATIPAYASAIAVGLGRMGQDRHWASDIVGSAALGVGTTQVFTAMHASRDAQVSRLALGPFAGPERALGLQVTLRF
jgi:membrane-associated phospholipid phosphatase